MIERNKDIYVAGYSFMINNEDDLIVDGSLVFDLKEMDELILFLAKAANFIREEKDLNNE